MFQAREALKKYLHYYERWENHSKSLQLEQQTLDRLKTRINEKVMKGINSSTWIDWQYLFVAATLLARCRYTLQYTYPYAYYMEASSRNLFEYQQVERNNISLISTTKHYTFNRHNLKLKSRTCRGKLSALRRQNAIAATLRIKWTSRRSDE